MIWFSFETDHSLELSDLLDTISEASSFEDLKKLSVDQRRLSVLRLLRNQRTLLVVDAFERASDRSISAFIATLPRSCQLLISSRTMSGISDAEVIPLRPFHENDTLNFIRAKSVNKRLSAAPRQTMVQIHQATGGMPLALEWTLGQINSGRQTLESLLESLRGANVEEIYAKLFVNSYKKLSRYEKRIVWSLALFESGCSTLAMEYVSEHSKRTLGPILRSLIEMSLVHANDEFEELKVRYSIHPLFRNFIQTKLTGARSQTRNSLVRRLLEYYADYAQSRIFQAKGASQGSYQEFEVEQLNLSAVLDRCYEGHDGKMFLSFVVALSYYYYTYGYWTERIRRGYQGIEACKWLGDTKTEAWMLINEVGYLLIQREEYDEAERLIQSGMKLLEDRRQDLITPVQLQEDSADQLGIQFMLGIGFRYLAIIHAKRDEFDVANESFNKAIQIFTHLNRRTILANLNTEIGEAALRQGNYNKAQRCFDESLHYHLAQKDKKHWVNSWISKAYSGLADIALANRDGAGAKVSYEHSLAASTAVGDKEGIAYAKYRLAILATETGDKARAIQLARDALELYAMVGQESQIAALEDLINTVQSGGT